MCHIGGVETRALMSQILDLLRRATSSRTAIPARRTSPAQFTNIVQDGRLLPPRSPPSSAAWSSTSATAAAASTYTSPRRRSQRAAARHHLVGHPRLLGQHAGMPYLTG
jgi:dihydroorotase